MRMNLYSLLILGLPSLVVAENSDQWQSKISGEFGAVLTQGNTETTSINFGLNAELSKNTYQHDIKFSGLYSEDQETTTAEKYQLSYRIDRAWSEISGAFAQAAFTRDAFGAYQRQDNFQFGYRRTLLASDNQKLEIRPALGYIISEQQDVSESNSEAIFGLGLDWSWAINDKTSIANTLQIESGSNNTHSNNVLALSTHLHEKLSLKLGLELDHNSEVTADREALDVTSKMNIVYQFK